MQNTNQYNTVYEKTAGLSDISDKFSFCHTENFSLSDICPVTLHKSQILMTEMFYEF